jgi:hypothetical protein
MTRKVVEPEAEMRARKLSVILETSNGRVKPYAEEIAFPPFSTCCLCVNRLSNKCMEECAPVKNYRHFKLRPNVGLMNMPRFPLREFLEEMPAATRQIVAAVYFAKIVDELQGP